MEDIRKELAAGVQRGDAGRGRLGEHPVLRQAFSQVIIAVTNTLHHHQTGLAKDAPFRPKPLKGNYVPCTIHFNFPKPVKYINLSINVKQLLNNERHSIEILFP